MSITIKHLEGPLKGQEKHFDASDDTILFGRCAEAHVLYPEECTVVGARHLRLKRNESGRYSIELCGDNQVEVDGNPAKNNSPVTSGSIIRLGRAGPTFEVLLPGVTIRHVEGPLAGQHQHFGLDAETITFGRPDQKTDISYPANYLTVGRLHFSLKKTGPGTYSVQLTPKHYVAIDGIEADNNQVVPSGSKFRLGDDDGPSFIVAIEQPQVGGEVTKPNKPQVSTGKKLELVTQYIWYAGGALAVLFIAVGSYSYYVQQMHEREIVQLMQDFAAAKAEASDRAQKEFSSATLNTLENAVYLVAKKDGKLNLAEGTAWAFSLNKLATNAHVTEVIKGSEGSFFLIAPDGRHINIKSVTSHPGYLVFNKYKATHGTTRWGNFTPLDLINEYDVGIIEIEPSTPLPVDPATSKPIMLAFASKMDLEELAPGTPVASVGFPVEGLAGSATVTEAPPTLHFGYISALADVFMMRADPNHRLLIQHSVPVTGGASGSPLMDPSGKVIGIVNGGNTTVFKDPQESVNAKVRLPNAALINFAQRVDLLEDLANGTAETQLEKEQAYWRKTAERFDDYFHVAVKAFEDLAKSRYAVEAGKETVLGEGVLEAGKVDSFKLVSKSYLFEVVPGQVYGFIADAEGGVPIGINVKQQGTTKFLRDAKDPRQSSELELAPTAWITVSEPMTLEVIVWSLVTQPARYVVHAYSWDEPKSPPPAAAAASAAPQQ